MRKLFVCFVLIALVVSCDPRPQNPGDGVRYFKGNYDQALGEAAQQNKPVFIYGYTTWCGFCKKMEKSTFKEKSIDDYLNKNFINLTYDMEKGEGVKIARLFGMYSYPAYAIVDPKGNVVSTNSGYMSAQDFLVYLEENIKAIRP